MQNTPFSPFCWVYIVSLHDMYQQLSEANMISLVIYMATQNKSGVNFKQMFQFYSIKYFKGSFNNSG